MRFVDKSRLITIGHGETGLGQDKHTTTDEQKKDRKVCIDTKLGSK